MNKPLLIVGHGLAGCVLAMTCYRRSIPFRIVGCSLAGEASMASSGLIAPITGRRYVKAWRIDEFVDAANDFYSWSESILQQHFFFPVEIVRYLTHPESMIAWTKRQADPEYTHYVSDRKKDELERGARPYGILTGGYRLDTPGWLSAVRSLLIDQQFLTILTQPIHPDEAYDGIKVFATGAVDPFLQTQIIPNKGESLIVYMPEWTLDMIVKEEVFVIPLSQAHMYWVGSYYEPWPTSMQPTEEGKQRLLAPLLKVYSGPLNVVDHLWGIRPTVNDRRPLIGPWPLNKKHYLFNGMGTKGTSLAPFWANHLLNHILEGTPLDDEVNPSRYIPPYNPGKGASPP